MPVQLSNGVTLRETGETDERGFPVYTDDSGALYTNQNGEFVLSRPGGFDVAGFSNFLDEAGLGEYSPELTRTQQGVTGFTMPSSFYQPQLAADFEDQASEEIGAFFDKDLENLNKSIQLVRKQAEQVKSLEEGFQEKTEQRTFATEDREFGDILEQAQQGFSGKGTFTSGFRRGELENLDERRETNLDATRQQFEEREKGRELGFSQLLEQQDLRQETGELQIDRARNEALAARQEQLRAQEERKRQSALNVANQGFAQFLGSGGTA